MRLIDADAIPWTDLNDDPNSKIRVLVTFADKVNKMPTIEAERKKGKWILVKGSNGKDYHKCSECLHTQEITGVKNYCAVCGTEMEGR